MFSKVLLHSSRPESNKRLGLRKNGESCEFLKYKNLINGSTHRLGRPQIYYQLLKVDSGYSDMAVCSEFPDFRGRPRPLPLAGYWWPQLDGNSGFSCIVASYLLNLSPLWLSWCLIAEARCIVVELGWEKGRFKGLNLLLNGRRDWQLPTQLDAQQLCWNTAFWSPLPHMHRHTLQFVVAIVDHAAPETGDTRQSFDDETSHWPTCTISMRKL